MSVCLSVHHTSCTSNISTNPQWIFTRFSGKTYWEPANNLRPLPNLQTLPYSNLPHYPTLPLWPYNLCYSYTIYPFFIFKFFTYHESLNLTIYLPLLYPFPYLPLLYLCHDIFFDITFKPLDQLTSNFQGRFTLAQGTEWNTFQIWSCWDWWLSWRQNHHQTFTRAKNEGPVGPWNSNPYINFANICLSVCLFVCLSVCLFVRHTFSTHDISTKHQWIFTKFSGKAYWEPTYNFPSLPTLPYPITLNYPIVNYLWYLH